MAIEITVPRLGWSMDEGTFTAWLKEDGAPVKPGDFIFSIESDKAVQEIEALDSGTLRIPPDAPKPGDIVKVGQRLGYLVAAGEALPAPTPPVSALAPPAAAPAASASAEIVPASAPSTAGQAPASPRARRAATELGVDLAALHGTGKGGRVRERDVRNHGAPLPPSSGAVPVTPLRRAIAERMVNSLRNTAPVTLTTRADATNLVALRNQFKTAGAAALVPAYTDIVAKLVAVALLRHPLLAARWDNERIVLPAAIHIGIAVDTEHGLLVPVIRDVPTLTLPELARRARDLIAAARERRLKTEDLQGGTFTITNLGGFGIEGFTPIINYPETAVLGLGAIRRELVALEDGRAASREQLTLSLTFDHRVVDGAPAARFLQTLRQGLENPAAWLFDGHTTENKT